MPLLAALIAALRAAHEAFDGGASDKVKATLELAVQTMSSLVGELDDDGENPERCAYLRSVYAQCFRRASEAKFGGYHGGLLFAVMLLEIIASAEPDADPHGTAESGVRRAAKPWDGPSDGEQPGASKESDVA